MEGLKELVAEAHRLLDLIALDAYAIARRAERRPTGLKAAAVRGR